MFNTTKQCKHGFFVYNRNDMYVGKSLELYGEFSEGEQEIFRQFVRTGDSVIEVGANIGAHTVGIAKLAGAVGQVHAFEPQRIIFQTLCANIALNSITNTHCYQCCIGSQEGEISIPNINYMRMNNFGGVELGEDAQWRSTDRDEYHEMVPVATLDSMFQLMNKLRLLKVDVEGMEIDVLRGATELIHRTRPALYVENDRHDKSKALVDYMHAMRYYLYEHNPYLYNPYNYFKNKENVFMDIASANILGIPQEAEAHIEGLSPVQFIE